MARTKLNPEEDIEMQPDSVQESIEEPIEEPIEDVIPKKQENPVVNTGKKNVKVRVVEDIDCVIAGVPYQFPKNKEVSVPSDVAAIFCFAQKAFRI